MPPLRWKIGTAIDAEPSRTTQKTFLLTRENAEDVNVGIFLRVERRDVFVELGVGHAGRQRPAICPALDGRLDVVGCRPCRVGAPLRRLCLHHSHRRLGPRPPCRVGCESGAEGVECCGVN